MATESSAVVRFINLAQQAQNPVRPTAPPAPITSEFGTEIVRDVRRARPNRVPLIVGAIALAGGAAAGGIYLGKNGFGSDDTKKSAAPAPAAAAAVTAPVVAERAEAPAAAAEVAPTPQVTSPVVSVPTDVLAATGFDIRVEPGATISLDGLVLGKAPLRVRNLQPGAHVVDIEAPPGFFSRRIELALGAGEAKELKIGLDAIEDEPSVAGDEPAPRTRAAKASRAEIRRERKEKQRQELERKQAMRATKAAAARAARQAKADGSAKKSAPVVAEPLPEEPKESAEDKKMSAADAELEAAMADIVGKPKRSAASAAGASSLSASSDEGSSGGKGTLMLGSKPPCDIIVDGKPTGLKTPQRAMELSPGTHRVILVNKELGLEKKFKVKIASGKTTKAIQDLTSDID